MKAKTKKIFGMVGKYHDEKRDYERMMGALHTLEENKGWPESMVFSFLNAIRDSMIGWDFEDKSAFWNCIVEPIKEKWTERCNQKLEELQQLEKEIEERCK